MASKNIIKFSAVALGMALAGSSYADSFDVKVTGVINPAACVATISGGDTIDYGTIPQASLSAANYTELAEKQTGFTIVCDGPTKVALQAVDNRAGTAANPKSTLTMAGLNVSASTTLLGLGTDPSGNNIGSFAVSIASGVTTDTESTVDSLQSQDNGTTWSKAAANIPALMPVASGNQLVAFAKAGETTPLAFTTLSGTLRVQAGIAPTSTLDLSQPVVLDGSVTVEMKYL